MALDALATMVGCTIEWPALPDGSRPDVLRLDARHLRLFVGDAKHSETPGCSATATRLTAYANAIERHVIRCGGSAVFALCHGWQTEEDQWMEVIARLLGREGLAVQVRSPLWLPGLGSITWFEVMADHHSAEFKKTTIDSHRVEMCVHPD
jgi:hypothetical protein